jgi:hypothetical protein
MKEQHCLIISVDPTSGLCSNTILGSASPTSFPQAAEDRQTTGEFSMILARQVDQREAPQPFIKRPQT